jgi:hypothetical protein
VSLHRYDASAYTVELRFSQPDSETDVRSEGGDAQIDINTLQKFLPGSPDYSQALTSSLFSDPAVLTAFSQAVASVQTSGSALRIRLLIGPSAPELHGVHWEALRHPQSGSPLCTDENILFSRYLSSLDWRPVHLRPKGDLKALVVVANPSNLSEFQNLAPIDVEGETSRARANLGSIQVTSLPLSPADAAGGRATLNNLIARLRDENPDILYLVCHGALARDEPKLWLEDDEGKAAVTSGSELATRLRELPQRPLLVVLASCQSAAHPTYGAALSALGPRLAEAGIPAVIAMQASVSLETIAAFMPVFFAELQKDGQIDRALVVARGAVRQRQDYWMPALFMRLKSGRIWYVPGFSDEGPPFKWPFLLRKIEQLVCTPILGPGLTESLLGSQGEIARSWAQDYRYPLEPSERESLPQVAQYLTVDQYKRAPYDELEGYLKKALQKRYASSLPPELKGPKVRLDDLILEVGSQRRKKDPYDSYRVLAELRLPIYITANYDNLLAAAVQELGNDPQVVLCPWNGYVDRLPSIYDNEPGYQPTSERPLIYHLFGRLNEPKSVVLTEDDYFQFLAGVTRNQQRIPKDVLGALVDSALMVLGFRIDDWQFRILFHSLLDQPGNDLRDDHPHLAVQLQPEEERTLDPRRAREYLERYYNEAKIRLFWGTVEDFIRQLAQQRNRIAS